MRDRREDLIEFSSQIGDVVLKCEFGCPKDLDGNNFAEAFLEMMNSVFK